MRKSTFCALGLFAMLVGCEASMKDLGGSPSPSLTDGDNNWFKMITESNTTEIQISQLAITQSQDSAVKQFAQKMIDDHTMAGNQVQSLASDKGVMLPTSLDSKHQGIVDDLKKRSGSDFDKMFYDDQVKAHEETVKFDQNEANNASDPQVKLLASKLLDTLKMHLQMAKQLQSSPSSGM